MKTGCFALGDPFQNLEHQLKRIADMGFTLADVTDSHPGGSIAEVGEWRCIDRWARQYFWCTFWCTHPRTSYKRDIFRSGAVVLSGVCSWYDRCCFYRAGNYPQTEKPLQTHPGMIFPG